MTSGQRRSCVTSYHCDRHVLHGLVLGLNGAMSPPTNEPMRFLRYPGTADFYCSITLKLCTSICALSSSSLEVCCSAEQLGGSAIPLLHPLGEADGPWWSWRVTGDVAPHTGQPGSRSPLSRHLHQSPEVILGHSRITPRFQIAPPTLLPSASIQTNKPPLQPLPEPPAGK